MNTSYLDSTILVAWMLPKDWHHAKAKAIMNDVKTGRIVAIISSLVVMEVIDVIRKRITESSPYAGSINTSDMSSLESEIKSITTDFLDGLSALTGQDKLIWYDPPQTIEKLFNEAFDVLHCSFGNFSDRPPENPGYSYRGAGQYDVQHALIARGMAAYRLITFDKGFQSIADKTNFRGKLLFDMR